MGTLETNICWGSSKSYSPSVLREAYSPSLERKSGIPQETPGNPHLWDFTDLRKGMQPTYSSSSQDEDSLWLSYKLNGIFNSIVLWQFLSLLKAISLVLVIIPKPTSNSHMGHGHLEKVQHRFWFSFFLLRTLYKASVFNDVLWNDKAREPTWRP